MSSPAHEPGERAVPAAARRAVGLVVVVLSLAPVYRLLSARDTGTAGEANLRAAEANLALAWWGLLVVVGVGVTLAILRPADPVRRAAGALARWLSRPPTHIYAALVGLLSFGLSALTLAVVYEGYLTNIDEMASLVHARYLAGGLLGGPVGDHAAGWLFPNTLLSDTGLWVSQYPPSHLALLAVGVLLGAPLLTGAVLLGVMVAFTAAVADELLPVRRPVARVGSLLVATSPLLVFLGGGILSHTSAGAFAVVALYAALRARRGHWAWAVLAGTGIGVAVASRPWTGLVLGALFTLGVWLPAAAHGGGLRWLLSRAGATALGGIPFAIGLAWFDARLFGHPLRLGYSAAYGPGHGLGFHRDPWGYLYGPLEALGYTSADLLSFGIQLTETPVGLPLLAGLYLLLARRIPSGARLLAAWAILPVAANAFYWFHSARMLYEAAPAWILLGTLAAADLAGGRRAGEAGSRASDMVAWSLVAALAAGLLYYLPERARSYRWTDETRGFVTAPVAPPGEARLVFVHTSWNERLSAGLQEAGMRSDSVISALRRNGACSLETYLGARRASLREGRTGPLPAIDLRALPGWPEELELVSVNESNRIRLDPRVPLTPECSRQLRADSRGTVALAPLLWQGDLPGLDGSGTLFVRDLGPDRNRVVLERHPGRRPYLLLPGQLWAYEDGVRLVWDDPPDAEDGGRAPGGP